MGWNLFSPQRERQLSSKRYRFEPQPDITAYEVARLLNEATDLWTGSDTAYPLPEGLKRHFVASDGSHPE